MDSPIDVVPVGRYEAMPWGGQNLEAIQAWLAARASVRESVDPDDFSYGDLIVNREGRLLNVPLGWYLLAEIQNDQIVECWSIHERKFPRRYRRPGETRVIEGVWEDDIQKLIIGGVEVDRWLCDVPLDWTRVRVTIEKLEA